MPQAKKASKSKTVRKEPRLVKRFKVYDAPDEIFKGITERLDSKQWSYMEIAAWSKEQGFTISHEPIRQFHHYILNEAKANSHFEYMVSRFAEARDGETVEVGMINVMMHLLQDVLIKVQSIALGDTLSLEEADKLCRLVVRVWKVKSDVVGMNKRLGIEVGNVAERIRMLSEAGEMDSLVADALYAAVVGIPSAIGVPKEFREEEPDI